MKKILAVIDMQNDFIDGALGTKEAEAIVPGVIQKIRDFDGTVIATRDTHGEDYLNTEEGKNLPVVHCVKGTHGWEIQSGIKEALLAKPDSLVIDKPTFGSVELGEYVKKLNESGDPVEEITLIGLCTDICVISNALLLKAYLPEVPIRVVKSCCAGVTPESHIQAIEAMKMCQIEVIE
ncbi:cysteine hydrolase [Ruminococcus sp. CLA-AA-H200]|uniref:nicotinamidase n=1 Tax=Ruminococcus turbiniformis TaxID=2881258 RepID=A0ABS8FTF3_9FIRM|nr:isochorismatase family cysteine hydrolase [Ruminococcus turbiniformis]MCC2253331.1 cysteine hydrolase [Ruminococcus turbiniformis]